LPLFLSSGETQQVAECFSRRRRVEAKREIEELLVSYMGPLECRVSQKRVLNVKFKMAVGNYT
jgi:hypothetical protein